MLWSRIVFLTVAFLMFAFVIFYWQGRRKNKATKLSGAIKQESQIEVVDELSAKDEEVLIRVSHKKELDKESAAFDPETIIIQAHAAKGKPYMGYELLQSLLAVGLRFGDMNLFHRHEGLNGKGALLFSVAAATASGTFEINNMGAFSCGGLVFFMKLDPKRKLMKTFDLMIDTARQLIDDLGGELCNERNESLNANTLRQLRERICEVEGGNQYASDLLDNLLE